MQMQARESFERTVARALALVPNLAEKRADVLVVEKAVEAVSLFDHNVGDCGGGCGGGAACGGAGGCVCQAGPPDGWPGDYNLPGGFTWGQGGTLVLPDGRVLTPPGSTSMDALPMLPGAQQMPNPNALQDNWQAIWARLFRGMRCKPYENAIKDCVMMTPVWSLPATIAAGATANVDIQPPNGWLDGYYFDVAIRTAAGVAVNPEGISMTIPTVVGCAVPRCAATGVGSGRFMQATNNDCCCGRAFRSIIPPVAQATPLRTAITNQTAADIIVQTLARGLCHSTSICV